MKVIARFLVLIACILCIRFDGCEAKTYVNKQRGYSIWIPDYFVERDNFGIYDFSADGGDDFGAKKYLNGGEGIEVTISTRACDIEEADETYVEKRISELVKIDQLWFPNRMNKVNPWVAKPYHLGTMSYSLSNDGYISLGIEIIAHSKKISVSVSGNAHSQETLNKVVNTALDIFESFVCLKH
ncbi:MAG: hypothetical protein MJ048_00465 [Acidaminococcaceae bacterium]|nr:hypothetical protein [Acidaminococcaceae bacterium]